MKARDKKIEWKSRDVMYQVRIRLPNQISQNQNCFHLQYLYKVYYNCFLPVAFILTIQFIQTNPHIRFLMNLKITHIHITKLYQLLWIYILWVPIFYFGFFQTLHTSLYKMLTSFNIYIHGCTFQLC